MKKFLSGLYSSIYYFGMVVSAPGILIMLLSEYLKSLDLKKQNDRRNTR